MKDIAALVQTLFKDYLRHNNESIVLVFDEPTRHVAEKISELYSGHVPRFTAINLSDVASGVMSQADATTLVQHGLWGGRPIFLSLSNGAGVDRSFRVGLYNLVPDDGIKAGLPGCTIEVLEAGFHKENNPAFVEELYMLVQKETQWHITCDRGTDLWVTLDPKYRAAKSDGKPNPGIYANPLPAEVFIHPGTVKGKLVITGSLGQLDERFEHNHHELIERLDRTPMVWTIEDGRIKQISCEDEELYSLVRAYVFDKDENGPRIGEVGLPANLYILNRDLTGRTLLDEKGRVHIAHGSGYNDRTGCTYECAVHGDGLIANASVFSQRLGAFIMKDNRYNPDLFPSLRQ
jgi:hypothetical protein